MDRNVTVFRADYWGGEIKMEAGTKETLCSKCLHLWVCKYKEELLETTNKADAIFNGSRFGYELECPEYIENGTKFGMR